MIVEMRMTCQTSPSRKIPRPKASATMSPPMMRLVRGPRGVREARRERRHDEHHEPQRHEAERLPPFAIAERLPEPDLERWSATRGRSAVSRC